MRTTAALLTALALTGCKKGPEPTVPIPPDASRMAAGDNVDLPEATVFHLLLKSVDHAGPLFAFYAPEMEKRGATRKGDLFSDDNITHAGGFGRDGTASVKDPTKPAVYLQIIELGSATMVDIWESVPKAH